MLCRDLPRGLVVLVNCGSDCVLSFIKGVQYGIRGAIVQYHVSRSYSEMNLVNCHSSNLTTIERALQGE